GALIFRKEIKINVKTLIGLLAVTLLLSVAAFAQGNRSDQQPPQPKQQGGQPPQQHGQQPRQGGGDRGVGNGHIPAHGPAPVHTAPPSAAPARGGAQGGRDNEHPSSEP